MRDKEMNLKFTKKCGKLNLNFTKKLFPSFEKFGEILRNSELRAPSEWGRITTSYADEQVQEMLQLLARKTDTRQQQQPPTKAVGGRGSRRLRYGHEFPPSPRFVLDNKIETWNFVSQEPEDSCSILNWIFKEISFKFAFRFDQIQMIKQKKVGNVRRPWGWRKSEHFVLIRPRQNIENVHQLWFISINGQSFDGSKFA